MNIDFVNYQKSNHLWVKQERTIVVNILWVWHNDCHHCSRNSFKPLLHLALEIAGVKMGSSDTHVERSRRDGYGSFAWRCCPVIITHFVIQWCFSVNWCYSLQICAAVERECPPASKGDYSVSVFTLSLPRVLACAYGFACATVNHFRYQGRARARPWFVSVIASSICPRFRSPRPPWRHPLAAENLSSCLRGNRGFLYWPSTEFRVLVCLSSSPPSPLSFTDIFRQLRPNVTGLKIYQNGGHARFW